jgi:sugar phosphate isomerase/epimerase
MTQAQRLRESHRFDRYTLPMVILSHGSDLSLAPTITPLVSAAGGGVRKAMSMLAAEDFHAVQLDAALRGIRPRELSRTGRRDLTTAAARAGIRLAGIDLFVPRKHLLSDEHVDRAVSAIVEAVQLAGDLGRIPLSLLLPLEEMAEEAVSAILEAADGHGVPLAIHAERDINDAAQWLGRLNYPSVGLGLDPATLLLQGGDAVEIVQKHGTCLASARLSDADSDLGQRTVVGRGDLDVSGYRIGVDLATRRVGPVVLDLRSLQDPLAALREGGEAWEDATFSLGSPPTG